jgi:hypothetical protein
MQANNGPSQKGAGPPDPGFRLQFTVQGGNVYADGLYQWMTVLNARGGTAPRASMLLTRHNGDLIGRPVGLFSQSLTPERSRQIESQLDAIATAALPEPARGDVMVSMLRLDYTHGRLTLNRQFSALSSGFLSAIDPAMKELRDLMSELLTKPERAIVVSVERSEDGRYGLKLTNIGVSDMIVADPRIPRASAPGGTGLVRVAPAPVLVPGQMELPPRWQRIPLEPAPPVPDTGLTIKPQESLLIQCAPWPAPASGEYVAQATWEDYAGPSKIDPKKVQAPIPKDADSDPKPLVLRGAAFSSYFRFKV